MRKFLYAKLHRLTVTEANLDYQGSITLPPALLAASQIMEHEAVWVWNVTSGTRFETYTIQGTDPTSETEIGRVCVNGAAAHLVNPGDVVIVASFILLSALDAKSHIPKAVFVNEYNQVIKISGEKAFAV